MGRMWMAGSFVEAISKKLPDIRCFFQCQEHINEREGIIFLAFERCIWLLSLKTTLLKLKH